MNDSVRRAASTHAVNGEVTRTFVRRDQHDFVFGMLRDTRNQSPRFSLVDLTSACVSIAAQLPEALQTLIRKARGEFASPVEPCDRLSVALWPSQFLWLREVQKSPANNYPNPKFDLGDLTSACIALARQNASVDEVLAAARRNLLRRCSEIGQDDGQVQSG